MGEHLSLVRNPSVGKVAVAELRLHARLQKTSGIVQKETKMGPWAFWENHYVGCDNAGAEFLPTQVWLKGGSWKGPSFN